MAYSAMELAEAFLKTGELDDALAAIQQQLEDQPQDDVARRLKIQIQLRLLPVNLLNSLISDFEQLENIMADDWQTQSVIHEKSGNLIAALTAIQEARRLESENLRLVERELDLLLANESYEQALSLIQKQARTWSWLEREGDVHVLLGNDSLATARYSLVLSHLYDLEGVIHQNYLHALQSRVMLACAHAYRRLGNTAIAFDLYQSAQLILGEDVTILFNLGLLSEMTGDHQQAIEQCQTALNQASDTLRANMMQALDEDARFNDLKADLDI